MDGEKDRERERDSKGGEMEGRNEERERNVG